MNYQTCKINLRLFLETQFPGWVKPREFGIADKIINQKVENVLSNEIEIFLLYDFFEENAVVIDIGANRGLYTYIFTRYGKNYEVVAFEPVPELARRLKKIFNKKANVYHYAISDNTTVRQLKIPYINNTIFRTRATLETTFYEENENKNKTIDVSCIKLDDFVQKNNIRNVNFIKIDVEGHEFEVLKGAEHTLTHMRPVLLAEIEKRHHPELPIQYIFEWLHMRNYEGLFIDREENKIKSLIEFEPDNHQNINNINTKNYVNNFIFCDFNMTKNLKSYISNKIKDKYR